jgi:hypothetical protein
MEAGAIFGLHGLKGIGDAFNDPANLYSRSKAYRFTLQIPAWLRLSATGRVLPSVRGATVPSSWHVRLYPHSRLRSDIAVLPKCANSGSQLTKRSAPRPCRRKSA